MTQRETTRTASIAVSVARQGVFDARRRLWGYELYCVGNTDDTPSGVPLDSGVPISVAASSGVGLQQIIGRDKRVMVNLTEKNILDDQAYVLPPASTMILVEEQIYRRPGVASHLDQLKADGFAVAVPDFTGADDCEGLYRLADVIGVEVGERPHHVVAGVAEAARAHGVTLLARLVPDAARFATCQELGFDLYQGPFSKAPEIVPMRKVSSSQIIRFKLLEFLEADEPDLQGLAKQIETDASISFRLLTYLNSAYFGLRHQIKSISHAINLLGWRQIRNWLRVVLLSDIGEESQGAELLRVAAQRARFLELISQRYAFWGFEPDSMHLLGLFSLLDAMIGVPMREIVPHLPLGTGLKEALCREPDSEYLPLLALAQDLEEARWDAAEAAVSRLNLDNGGVKAAFQDAVGWAGDLGAMMEAEQP